MHRRCLEPGGFTSAYFEQAVDGSCDTGGLDREPADSATYIFTGYGPGTDLDGYAHPSGSPQSPSMRSCTVSPVRLGRRRIEQPKWLRVEVKAAPTLSCANGSSLGGEPDVE